MYVNRDSSGGHAVRGVEDVSGETGHIGLQASGYECCHSRVNLNPRQPYGGRASV
jgi:hypothetical protein